MNSVMKRVNNFWPHNLRENIYHGFSDDDLSLVCSWGAGGSDRLLPYKRAHWIYWASELYSFGRCYREWLGLPSWMPLPIYGDHGVDLCGRLSIDEVSSSTRSHITWSAHRARRLMQNFKKHIIRVPHPWILFRRRHNISKRSCARGTLIFFTHSVPGIDLEDYDFDAYFSKLNELPEKFKPFVICMHTHDIQKGYHKEIRKYGIPIVSAGDTSSPYFINRFYDIITRFEFASSNEGGSELFYCEEVGVKYFIFGSKPTFINRSLEHIPLGVWKYRDDLEESLTRKKFELFSLESASADEEKYDFTRDILGLDVDESQALKLLRKEVIHETISSFGTFIYALFISLTLNFLPHSFQVFARKVKHFLLR